MDTNQGHNAPILEVTREEIIEDNLSEYLVRKGLIPSVKLNVDLTKTTDPEYVFSRVEEEFRKLSFQVEIGRAHV